jgi:AraC-like DNA-binding protein
MTERPTGAAVTGATTASGYVGLLLGVGVSHYGIPRPELMQAAALSEGELADPGALVPEQALFALLRFIRARSGDPALGLRMADALDLRAQGFFGYALMSSMTMRERLDIHLRYATVRSSVRLALRLEGEQAVLDMDLSHMDKDLIPLVCDWGIGTACVQHRRRMQRSGSNSQLEVWLAYPEQPHHRELRAMVGGVVVFDAPCTRLAFPASDLEKELPGDPHLGKLAVAQLDNQLSTRRSLLPAAGADSLLAEVRARLLARLASDASLERIARDLHISTRTLRRRLDALGTSFQALLEEVRRSRAVAYLADTELAVEQISVQLGYGDPANFRRAFRRWEGVAPSTFRATRRADATPAQSLAPLAPPRSASCEPAPASLPRIGSERGWPAHPLSDAE